MSPASSAGWKGDGSPAPLSFADALELLRSSHRVEALSHALGGPGVLVIDLAMPDAPPPGDVLEATRRALAELPCPSIGVKRGGLGGGLANLRRGLDCVVTDAEEGARDDEGAIRCTLAPVLAGVLRNPQASLTLAQLIRHGQGLDLHEALIAESLAYSTLQSGLEFAEWLERRGPPKQRPVPDDPAVLVERLGDSLELTLNRSHKHNAFSAAMRDGLAEALALAVSDETIERIDLCGRGPSFCSGGDLDEFGTFPDPTSAHVVRSTRNPGRQLTALAERTHVRVHGHCLGAGVELPAFAAHVTADPGTTFRLPEVAMGLVPGAGGTASLPRRIGRQHCAWLALSGVAIDAATALAWGLVDEIDSLH